MSIGIKSRSRLIAGYLPGRTPIPWSMKPYARCQTPKDIAKMFVSRVERHNHLLFTHESLRKIEVIERKKAAEGFFINHEIEWVEQRFYNSSLSDLQDFLASIDENCPKDSEIYQSYVIFFAFRSAVLKRMEQYQKDADLCEQMNSQACDWLMAPRRQAHKEKSKTNNLLETHSKALVVTGKIEDALQPIEGKTCVDESEHSTTKGNESKYKSFSDAELWKQCTTYRAQIQKLRLRESHGRTSVEDREQTKQARIKHQQELSEILRELKVRGIVVNREMWADARQDETNEDTSVGRAASNSGTKHWKIAAALCFAFVMIKALGKYREKSNPDKCDQANPETERKILVTVQKTITITDPQTGKVLKSRVEEPYSFHSNDMKSWM